MTPPHWLFFPTPPAAGVKLQLDAELVASSSTRFNITNATLSGTDDVANNYVLYTLEPLRKASTYIEWILKVDSSGDYANGGAWKTANFSNLVLAESTWTHDGAVFNATSINVIGRSNSDLLRVRWVGSSTDVTNFWNTLDAGETTQLILNWP